MSTIERSIDVELPVRAVYDQWTQFEEFPRFMEGVEKVEQLDDTHLRWVASIGGARREWRAEISEQEPDRRIAWHSLDGAHNAGVVTFHRLADQRTRIMLQLEFEPEGPAESIGDRLGLVGRRTAGDLERFKDFVESRGGATVGWRGEVEQGRVTGDDPRGARVRDTAASGRDVGEAETASGRRPVGIDPEQGPPPEGYGGPADATMPSSDRSDGGRR